MRANISPKLRCSHPCVFLPITLVEAWRAWRATNTLVMQFQCHRPSKSPRLLHNQSKVALWHWLQMIVTGDELHYVLLWTSAANLTLSMPTQHQLRIGCQTPLTEASFVAQKNFAFCSHGPMQSRSLPILESPKSRRKHAIAAPTVMHLCRATSSGCATNRLVYVLELLHPGGQRSIRRDPAAKLYYCAPSPRCFLQ